MYEIHRVKDKQHLMTRSQLRRSNMTRRQRIIQNPPIVAALGENGFAGNPTFNDFLREFVNLDPALRHNVADDLIVVITFITEFLEGRDIVPVLNVGLGFPNIERAMPTRVHLAYQRLQTNNIFQHLPIIARLVTNPDREQPEPPLDQNPRNNF